MEKRADGGKMEHDKESDPLPYNAKGSETEKEAEEGRAKGGRMKKKAGGMVEGHEKKARLDRPGRKRGGKIGADSAPLTTAGKIRDASEHKTDDDADAAEDD
jgi:hypothetical protein